MLENTDITKIINAMENIFPTEIKMDKRFDKVEESFSDLQTSVDAYAKKSNDYFQEMVVANNNYRRLNPPRRRTSRGRTEILTTTITNN